LDFLSFIPYPSPPLDHSRRIAFMNLFGWRNRDVGELYPEFHEHCRHLSEEGFAHIRGGFPPAVVEEVLKGVKQALARNEAIFGRHLDADGHYPRIINLHLLHHPLLRLFTESSLALAVQDAFFGAPSSLYTSLYFERGSAQSTHRDTPYFATRPEYRYLGVWVALEDADEFNGCLEIIRRGHLVPEPDRPAIALQNYKTLDEVPPTSPSGHDILWDEYQAKVVDECFARGLSKERLEARAGDIIIWHPQLPHGGSHIQDLSRTRHSFVMHVTPVGTPVYQQDAFFNPEKPFSERAKWKYGKFGGRKYVEGLMIDIGHRENRDPKDFVR
jgi:ectoine hydroxylase-related dioxygenase (phytanoyl-CoA dioxygenase family)